MGTKCNGCDAVIYDVLYMACARKGCKKLYHLKCLALTREKFEEFTEEYKTSWTCPECVCNAPKSDNSDTPVRGNPKMSKILTPCYVNTNRGNKLTQKEISETDTESNKQILQELREFRLEMNLKMENQVREYVLLKDRFANTENELHQLRVTMEVLQEKASKVDELEAQIKIMEQNNMQPQRDLNKNQIAGSRNETMQEIREKTTFANVVSQNEKRVVKKHQLVNKIETSAATKSARIVTTGTNSERIDMKSLPITYTTEQIDHNKKEEEWTTVQNKKNKYISKQVIKGGNTSAGNIQGTERKKFLHVWRLKKNTTIENLESHIRSICGSNVEMTVEKIKHKTERDYASFIIGVPESQYELLCRPECWAVNIEFCEWVWFRKPPNKS